MNKVVDFLNMIYYETIYNQQFIHDDAFITTENTQKDVMLCKVLSHISLKAACQGIVDMLSVAGCSNTNVKTAINGH